MPIGSDSVQLTSTYELINTLQKFSPDKNDMREWDISSLNLNHCQVAPKMERLLNDLCQKYVWTNLWFSWNYESSIRLIFIPLYISHGFIFIGSIGSGFIPSHGGFSKNFWDKIHHDPVGKIESSIPALTTEVLIPSGVSKGPMRRVVFGWPRVLWNPLVARFDLKMKQVF